MFWTILAVVYGVGMVPAFFAESYGQRKALIVCDTLSFWATVSICLTMLLWPIFVAYALLVIAEMVAAAVVMWLVVRFKRQPDAQDK